MDINTDGHIEHQQNKYYGGTSFEDWFYDNEEELLLEFRALLHPEDEVDEDKFASWWYEMFTSFTNEDDSGEDRYVSWETHR